MLFRNTYTAIDRDMQRIEPGQHQAASLDVYGWSWRLPEAYEAALVPDYSRASYPLTPTEFFPDCDGEIIWTATENLTPPSGCARFVSLGYGGSGVNRQSNEFFARAVRAGECHSGLFRPLHAAARDAMRGARA